MTQPTQEEINERAKELPDLIAYNQTLDVLGYSTLADIIAELQLKVEALESLQRNAGKETDEEVNFADWLGENRYGDDYIHMPIRYKRIVKDAFEFKAGRAFKP